MKVIFEITNPSLIVTDQEIKSVVSAGICHEIFMGRCFPPIVHIRLVKSVIRRGSQLRTGELKYDIGKPDGHIIRVVYGGRTKQEILASLFHETSHLLRLYNADSNADLVLEEQENTAQMNEIGDCVEWMSLVLVDYSKGTLRSLA